MSNITVTDGKIVRQYNPYNHTFYHIGRDGKVKAVLPAKITIIDYTGLFRLLDPLTKRETEMLKSETKFTATSRDIQAGGVWEQGIVSFTYQGIELTKQSYNRHILTPALEEMKIINELREKEKEKELVQKQIQEQNEKEAIHILEELKNLSKLPQLLGIAIDRDDRNKFFGDRAQQLIFNMPFAKDTNRDRQYDILKYIWDHKDELKKINQK